MKVIKKGKIKIKTWRIICNDCNSYLEYNQADIISSQREGEYIQCPECKKYISHDITKGTQ